MANEKDDEKFLSALSAMYTDITIKMKRLEEEKAVIKRRMWEFFDKQVGKGNPAEVDCGDGFLFRRELRSRVSLDEENLQFLVGPEVWKKITVVNRQIDEAKLKKAIVDGTVKKEHITKSTVKKNALAFTHPKVKTEKD